MMRLFLRTMREFLRGGLFGRLLGGFLFWSAIRFGLRRLSFDLRGSRTFKDIVFASTK